MKKNNAKRSSPRARARSLKEIEKEFDFSRVKKKVVTINLDSEIIDYFKDLSEKSGKGYQVLIKDALKYFIEHNLEPQNVWERKV